MSVNRLGNFSQEALVIFNVKKQEMALTFKFKNHLFPHSFIEIHKILHGKHMGSYYFLFGPHGSLSVPCL